MGIKHAKVSAKSDGADTSLVRPSDWNADHTAQSSFEFLIDGGGSEITDGAKGDIEVPYDCTISRVSLFADDTGSIVVDIWKTSYSAYPPSDVWSITGSTPPTISSGYKAQDTTLSGWSTSLSDGDILRFNVDSCSTITRVLVSIVVTEP